MRVGISTSVIQRGKTGVAQYVFALLRGLARENKTHLFTLFVLDDDLPLFDFLRGAMEIVPVPERFRQPVRNILWHQRELPRLVREKRLDVLHIPSYRRMLWRKPCHLVATIHDLAPFHVPKKYDWMRMLYGRVLVRRLAHRQARIIAISENTARDIIHFFGVPREKITVIHNGLDHERFHPASRAEARRSIGQKHGIEKPFFLYVARLEHPGKNHVPLIAAFEKFKAKTRSDWQLVFGGSDWHGAEEIHSAIQKSAVAADIRSLGFVPDEHLPELYRASEVFVYPSLYEGFGMPPIEAMACGSPVISSSRGSLAEVVADAAAIIDPADVNSMMQQLTRMATDPKERERFSAAGLSRAAQFDWKTTAARTLEVYGLFR
jgi:glycosyltransferase involved in cell wall biosynthesis